MDLYQSHPASPATTRAYYPRAEACCDRGSIRNVVVDDDTYVSLVLQMEQRGRPWMMLLHLGLGRRHLCNPRRGGLLARLLLLIVASNLGSEYLSPVCFLDYICSIFLSFMLSGPSM